MHVSWMFTVSFGGVGSGGEAGGGGGGLEGVFSRKRGRMFIEVTHKVLHCSVECVICHDKNVVNKARLNVLQSKAVVQGATRR